MRWTGIGAFRDYDDVAEPDRAWSPGRTRWVTHYITRHREDLYDDDTDYRVAVFEVATKKELVSFDRSCEIRKRQDETSGAPVVGARFGATDDDVIIEYEDGETEAVRIAATLALPSEPPLLTRAEAEALGLPVHPLADDFERDFAGPEEPEDR